MALALTGAGAVTGLSSLAGTLAWSSGTLRADTAAVATSQATASASYTDLATAGPAVTVTTGTKALVAVYADIYPSASGSYALMSFAVSGATTVAATDSNCVSVLGTAANNPRLAIGATFIITGLTAGSNTFTAKYRATGGTNGNFGSRAIAVIDLGS